MTVRARVREHPCVPVGRVRRGTGGTVLSRALSVSRSRHRRGRRSRPSHNPAARMHARVVPCPPPLDVRACPVCSALSGCATCTAVRHFAGHLRELRCNPKSLAHPAQHTISASAVALSRDPSVAVRTVSISALAFAHGTLLDTVAGMPVSSPPASARCRRPPTPHGPLPCPRHSILAPPAARYPADSVPTEAHTGGAG
jgi:hypothetical protein